MVGIEKPSPQDGALRFPLQGTRNALRHLEGDSSWLAVASGRYARGEASERATSKPTVAPGMGINHERNELQTLVPALFVRVLVLPLLALVIAEHRRDPPRWLQGWDTEDRR